MLHCTALPNHPLATEDARRIRSHPDVQSLIALGVDTIDRRTYTQQPPVENMVVLSEDAIVQFEYGGSDWRSEVLDTDASEGDLLERALKQLET
ncbi:hypothetical protein [Halococcus hamelinensis]|uniref:DUF7964 domain-containing protein n=1 Tax=Halococcus hamelinensis 100A6 TaxID=1132509 RepID=M0M261_9EURY|nr:hypothetical protein [Halococcus hamelinensis]EMA38679.1 hypothetical protein C447_09080 [Halococcus hamelinensis 100A6]